jgi:hypothetical protein
MGGKGVPQKQNVPAAPKPVLPIETPKEPIRRALSVKGFKGHSKNIHTLPFSVLGSFGGKR